MRSNKITASLLAPLCALLIGLGLAPVANAQSAGDAPTLCYRVTGLPSAGMVTNSEDPPSAINIGDTFDQPQALVYIAAGDSGDYYLTYDVFRIADGSCLTSKVVDSATVTFNIVDEDECTPKGRDAGCGPMNN